MGVTVLKPGVLTTVQDTGRTGYLGSGFSPSGVMDHRAYRIANLLVDNTPGAPVLEFCLTGPTLRFTSPTFIAVTGGNFTPTLDGAPVPMYKAVPVKRGQVLAFGAAAQGVFGYLAIAGEGLDVPEVMGSRSTNLKCFLGGWHGRALTPGDYISAVQSTDFLANLGSHTVESDAEFYGWNEDAVTLRVVPGPQEDLFTQTGIETFYTQEYKTTSQCDRMGFRLAGPVIETVAGSDIISDGIALGAIQVPSHGQPIIMLADRQTTGGYAKIGTVASVDIPKLVQCRPGKALRFERVTVQRAQELYREEEHLYATLARKVRRPSFGDESPRRTARRLTPILEAQARATANQRLWIRGSEERKRHPMRRATIFEVVTDATGVANVVFENGRMPAEQQNPAKSEE